MPQRFLGDWRRQLRPELIGLDLAVPPVQIHASGDANFSRAESSREAMSHLRILPPPQPAPDEVAALGTEPKSAEGIGKEGDALTEEMRKSASEYLRSMIRVVPDEKREK